MSVTLRETFDEDPDLYDRVRPRYPTALFDHLASLAELAPGSRVLEIGCGTGQATAALAGRGYEVVAVELGAGLARLARRNLAAFPAVQIVNAAFEEWPLPPDPFDLVIAATSFHWLDPALRITKSADALRAGGALAVISTHHVAGSGDRFFADAQRCYERWMPGTARGIRLLPAGMVPSDTAELESSERFERPVTRRYEREITYSTEEYLDLLLSYSNHRALTPTARNRLLACIAHLMDDRFDSRVAKRYMNQLAITFTSTSPARVHPR